MSTQKPGTENATCNGLFCRTSLCGCYTLASLAFQIFLLHSLIECSFPLKAWEWMNTYCIQAGVGYSDPEMCCAIYQDNGWSDCDLYSAIPSTWANLSLTCFLSIFLHWLRFHFSERSFTLDQQLDLLAHRLLAMLISHNWCLAGVQGVQNLN